jgi:hypothetical protein
MTRENYHENCTAHVAQKYGLITLDLSGKMRPPKTVSVFGARALLRDGGFLRELWCHLDGATTNDRSTLGEITGDQLVDETVIGTAIAFDKSWLRTASAQIALANSSNQVGEEVSEEASTTGELFGDSTEFVRRWAIHTQAAGAQRISATITALAKA